jgi:hypothetical protein
VVTRELKVVGGIDGGEDMEGELMMYGKWFDAGWE